MKPSSVLSQPSRTHARLLAQKRSEVRPAPLWASERAPARASWLRTVVAIAALALGVVAGGAPAGAHAQLVSTTPGDGATVDGAPGEVVLTFSERVSAQPGQVRVLGRDGERADTGGLAVDGSEITVPLRSGLPDGTYVVAWRAVSADSHPIHGAFTFGVGDAAAALEPSVVDALVGSGDDGPWRAVGTVTRTLGYGGALVAAGLAAFLALAHDGGDERRGLRRTVRAAAALGAAGLVLELPARAALATGLGPGSLTEEGVLGQVLADGVGVGLAVALLGLLFTAVDAGRDRVVAGAGVVALGAAWALAGHTATTSPAAVALVADGAHVAAAAVWLGGLVGLAVVAVRRRSGVAPVAARFSGLAGLALAVVAVAGGALGWTQVRTLDALVETPYGQLLIAKVALVGLVALLGGWNRYRLVPVLAADEGGRAGTHLRRTVVAEVALLAVAVAVTGALVDVTPARAAVAAPYAGTRQLGPGEVNIDVDPTRVGGTTIHVYTYDADGQPWDLPEGVELRFSLPSSEVSGLRRAPAVTGTGHWTYIGDDLSLPGTWTVEVVARTSLYTQETAAFTVRIS